MIHTGELHDYSIHPTIDVSRILTRMEAETIAGLRSMFRLRALLDFLGSYEGPGHVS